ncbi:hypothetical protein Tco_0740457 [Tanacetum coccineum]
MKTIFEEKDLKWQLALLNQRLICTPTIDLLNSSLEEFKQPEFEGYGVKVNKSVSENSSNKIKKTSGTPIIEDWVFDYDEDETLEKVSESANVQKPKQADQPRKVSQNPKNNSTNWNTPMSKKFGVGFSVFLQSWQSFRREAAPVKRSFYQHTALKNRNLNNKVNTVKVNSVNTAKGKRVISVVGEQGINAAKSTACWVWRPKIKVLDHVSKNNGSYICKQFDYVDPTGEDIDDSMNVLSVLVVYHTTNGHQFTMSNRQERIGYSRANDNWLTLERNGSKLVVVPGCTIVKIPILGDVDASTRFVGDSASKCPMIHLLREVTPWIDEGIQKLNELTNLLLPLQKVHKVKSKVKKVLKFTLMFLVQLKFLQMLPEKRLSKATPEEGELNCEQKVASRKDNNAMSYASADDIAVQSCFFDIQLTNLSPSNYIPPEVFLRVSMHPA